MPVRDTPVNLDESIYALVPVAADSAAVMEENNATLIDSLRVNAHDNTKNPTLTLALQLQNKDLQAPHRLGSSSENRCGEVSALYRYGETSNILEASGIDGVGKWSQQIIAEFGT